MSGYGHGYGPPPQGPVNTTTGDFSGAVTAGSFVGDVDGNANLADDPAIVLPAYRRWTARCGFLPTSLFRCQTDTGRKAVDAQAHLYSDINSSDTRLSGAGSPTVDYMLGGFRGILVPADNVNFSANVADPAANSVCYFVAFSAAAYSASTRALVGRDCSVETTKFRVLLADPGGAVNRAYLQLDDGTDDIQSDISGVDLEYGPTAIYLASIALNKATNLTTGRLSKLDAGLVGTPSSDSAAAIGTLTGGTSPLFHVGGRTSVVSSNGITFLGAGAVISSAVEVAGFQAALHSGLGFE